MALNKKEKKSLLQRIKNLVLGKQRPNLLTRVSVWAGFLIWIYLITWQLLTLISLLLMGSLKQSELVEGSFHRVGSKLYGYADTVNVLYIHTFIQLVLFGIMLMGLILIWRKKRLGFLLYTASNVSTLLATFTVLGPVYFSEEVPVMDIILIGATTIYFGIGTLWFYKWKAQKEKQTTPQQS